MNPPSVPPSNHRVTGLVEQRVELRRQLLTHGVEGGVTRDHAGRLQHEHLRHQRPQTSGGQQGAIELPSSATEVTVEITAPSGEVLRRIELGARAQGLSQFEWDGLNSFGEAVDLSEVRVRATASSQGQSNAVPTFVEGRVNSVLLDGLRGIVLNIQGAGSVPFADVRQLS